MEVNHASQTTFSTIRGVSHSTTKGSLFETTDPDPDPDQDPMVVEVDENEITDRDGSGSDPKRSRKDDECCVEIEVEEANSALRNNENDESSTAAKISDSQMWWISVAMADQETRDGHAHWIRVWILMGIDNRVSMGKLFEQGMGIPNLYPTHGHP
ncbi:hypothetical protein SO802_028396 [Lithocarpus litseifolius]|uniref:Uncharacterized protein n=1 Tax=Lithocarpus litseifolius TaxID=425828 RepID=A0AAW2BSM8_9ROSI